MPTTNPSTYNQDVAATSRLLVRVLIELNKSVSASQALGLLQFDRDRTISYLDAIVSLVDWVEGQPQLDLPETHPRFHDVGMPPDMDAVENEAVKDLMNLMVIARDELLGSQASRMPSGLIGFDSLRFRAIIAKARQYILAHLDVVSPVDLPESSPMAPMTGPGAGGV